MKVLFEIESKLSAKYNSPHYDNKEDVMDEIVYILLSKRTTLHCTQVTFKRLLGHFPDWGELSKTDVAILKTLIREAGLMEQKANHLKEICTKIMGDFGHFDLKRIFKEQRWACDEIFTYLRALPGIGPKSAYCIMLYSLKLPVMPADVHVIRIFYRLGLIRYHEDQHHQAQKAISEIVAGLPWSMLYSLHVNMKAHGEKVCQKQKCDRDRCVISEFCQY